MQKFTVFSIILSLCVIFILGDMVFHGYLNTNVLQIEEAAQAGTGETTEPIIENVQVDTSDIPEAKLKAADFIAAGFENPVLKDAVFDGNIFSFLTFSDQSDAYIYQWNFFDGETFIGSIYEVEYKSDTGGFQAYLTLRDRAVKLLNLGDVNETNSYKDASFYFNHKAKKNTVHLVIRKGGTIYAFQYAYSGHDKMKNLFEIITK